MLGWEMISAGSLLCACAASKANSIRDWVCMACTSRDVIILHFATPPRGQLESCIQFQTLVQERHGLNGKNSVEAHQDGQGLGQVP